MDFYYAADPCYRVKIERDRSWLYRCSRKFSYYAGLEANLFAKSGRTHLLLLTSMEVPDYQRFYGTEQERITVLPPSIENRRLSLEKKAVLRNNVRRRMGWPDDVPVVIFVGSGFATKGLDRAVMACSSAQSNLKFCIVGDGSSGKYEHIAKQLGSSDRVDFLGARDDAWELMAAADLMIHPARSENTGTVLVEALSAGTGVLTTDRCGFSNHVTDSSAGSVLPSPFVQANLEQELESLLSDPWQERAERALQYAAIEDLYSGMDTAVAQVMAFISGGQREVGS